MPAAFLDKGAVTRALRLALHPLPPHPHQLFTKEDDLFVDCNDNYRPQALSVKMNFIPKATEISQNQLHRTPPLPHGAAAMSLSSPRSSLRPHEIPDVDTNIYPALTPSVAASACRLSKVPHLPLIPPSSPVMQTPQTRAQQMMLPCTPHHSPHY